MSRIRSFRETGERYATLRVVGAISIVLGAIAMVVGTLLLAIGLVALLTDLVRPINGTGAAIFLVWSIGFFVAGLQSLASGAMIRLAIHVEENTRATAQALDKIREGLEPKPAVEDDIRSMFLS